MLRCIDIGQSYLTVMARSDRGHLVSLMFHGVISGNKGHATHVDDQLINTVDEFAQVIEYFKSQGFQFVRCKDLSAGLPERGRYVYLSFDDGNVNNTRSCRCLSRCKCISSLRGDRSDGPDQCALRLRQGTLPRVANHLHQGIALVRRIFAP